MDSEAWMEAVARRAGHEVAVVASAEAARALEQECTLRSLEQARRFQL